MFGVRPSGNGTVSNVVPGVQTGSDACLPGETPCNVKNDLNINSSRHQMPPHASKPPAPTRRDPMHLFDPTAAVRRRQPPWPSVVLPLFSVEIANHPPVYTTTPPRPHAPIPPPPPRIPLGRRAAPVLRSPQTTRPEESAMDAHTPQPGEVTDRNLALELVRVTEAA